METRKVTFDSDSKNYVLDILGKTVDMNNYIVEKNDPSQHVFSPNGEPVTLDDFAGVIKGSLVFVKKDLPSIIELADKLK